MKISVFLSPGVVGDYYYRKEIFEVDGNGSKT